MISLLVAVVIEGAAQHEHRPAKVGELGAVPGADEAETEHWWLQLQRGGKVTYTLYMVTQLLLRCSNASMMTLD